MTQTELMFELSHPARICLIRLAASRPVRHRDMALASGLPPSEVSRHVKRLMNNGLIRKRRDGNFEITRLGGLLLDRLDDFEFISFHAGYFERHDASDIPPGFDIHSMLRKCSILEDTMVAVNAILRINAESKSFINCILDEFNDALVSIQVEKLRSGLDISMMTRPGRRIPSEYTYHRHAPISIRTRSKIPFFFVANGREALFCLKGPGGRMDYSTAFISADPELLEWCGALFDHYWTRGKPVSL